jgi:glycosyltransferase involved in cell wall biosynthesis
METRSLRVSVVIASIVGGRFLEECLQSLQKQVRDFDAEVIVVACGEAEAARNVARRFPWVNVIHRNVRETVPALRQKGVEEASGDIIAIIEEHCVAAPNWLRQAAEALRSGDFGVTGGPVVDSGYERLRDWVVYFCEYNGYLPPWREGESHALGSANIAYQRTVLMRNRGVLDTGYWEAVLHPVLAAEGVRFREAPSMIVHHCGPFDYGYYLQQRYWFSRAFAGARRLTAAKRMVYCLASPAIPFLLLARMTRRVVERRCHPGKFVQVLPLLIPVLLVYVAGEFMGYLAGPGDALSKVE